jgi:hypothetical protein
VTLVRLFVAWLVVAIWFIVAAFILPIVVGLRQPVEEHDRLYAVSTVELVWKLVEAILLTLLASLWFDSLGSGEWWLIFILVGFLAAVPAQLFSVWKMATRQWLTFAIVVVAELVRYVVAGALLAWRLS